MEVEKAEKPKVEKPGTEEKRERRVLGHTPEEKCRAVLSVWTERRKPGEVCRELGVAWGVLQQWQDRAMEGMLLALQPRIQVERGVVLSPRLAVLLRKSQAGIMKGLDKRLKKLQGNPKAPQELREAAAEKKI
jgi:transposase-like protein